MVAVQAQSPSLCKKMHERKFFLTVLSLKDTSRWQIEESAVNLRKLIGAALLAAWFVFKKDIWNRMQYSEENNNY